MLVSFFALYCIVFVKSFIMLDPDPVFFSPPAGSGSVEYGPGFEQIRDTVSDLLNTFYILDCKHTFYFVLYSRFNVNGWKRSRVPFICSNL